MTKSEKEGKEETALAPLTQTFLALRSDFDPAAMAEALEENLGGEQASMGDLERISVAPGGLPIFTIKDGINPDGTADEIQGVIAFWSDSRAFWSKPYGGDDGATPPDCRSSDRVFGDGDNGTGVGKHRCDTCAMQQFGTAKNGGKGKACTDVRSLFILRKGREGAMFPSLLACKPGSLGKVRKAMFSLLQRGLPFYSVMHTFKCVPETNGRVNYGTVEMKDSRPLSPEELAAVKAYAKVIKPAFVSVDPFVANVTPEGEERPGPGADVQSPRVRVNEPATEDGSVSQGGRVDAQPF